MKTQISFVALSRSFIMFLLVFQGFSGLASPAFFQEGLNIEEYKGEVVDSRNGKELTSAYLQVVGTNISTITNSEGEFFLKVPAEHADASVSISHLGYQNLVLPADFFREGRVKIELKETIEVLSEISVFSEEDPRKVVREMLDSKRDNYAHDPAEMTAFYRETIKKGRRNVSLSEAVVNIHKKPYTSYARDEISLIKARKSADYDRLDTLAMKLRGGPFNPLVLDIMKDPDYMFYQDDLQNYEFSFDPPTKINNRYLYVVNFKDMNQLRPWYFGKLFIDAETKALVKAEFALNVDNRDAASQMFVKKKPGGTKVYPVNVTYKAEYRNQDGKWYFGYGNTEMEFVINWKRKLFNSRYTVNSELAITDWTLEPGLTIDKERFLKPNVVMADDVSGFADLNFWGANNIIEPDKTIENAIEKIQKNLRD